jgi:hypothetical protein
VTNKALSIYCFGTKGKMGDGWEWTYYLTVSAFWPHIHWFLGNLKNAITKYCKTRKFGALLYLAQRTLCAKISCTLKVFSLTFEDMLLSKCANINLRQCLHSGVCAKICMRQIFSFYSIWNPPLNKDWLIFNIKLLFP